MATAREPSYRTKQGRFLIVGALDFGTSYSGYAYSYNHEPNRVYRRQWVSSSRGITVEKTPTCILFDKSKSFSAFGFKAEEEYGTYCDEGQKSDWYFFKGYKLNLYDEMCLKQDNMIKDELGREFPLFEIVTETLRYLNGELIKDCKKRQDVFTERDMLRVITVPAIWSDSARYFMRNAAENAGIPADLINICLEPEAAAIYCKTVPCKSSKGDSKLLNFQPGQTYLVLDAGGGTVDIVVHEVEESGDLRELSPACGGDWGGTMVDRAFIDFMEQCIGKEAFSKFRTTEIYDFTDFMREFENRKRTVDTEFSDDANLLFRVPFSLKDIFQASDSKDLQRSAKRPDFKLQNDKMRLPYKRFLSFFSGSKERICEKLSDLFARDTLKDVDTILMVGGYSESLVLQKFIAETFKTKTIIIPNEPSSAVLQGAVMFGHDPSVIAERRCRYTYGVRTVEVFNSKLHMTSKRFIGEDGIARANDIFAVHVKLGQNVKHGVFQPAHGYEPCRKDQTALQLQLYASPRPDPIYTDEEGCKKIGSWDIDISDLHGKPSDKVVTVSFCFSDPLITVKAIKQQSDEEITHKVRYNWSSDHPTDQSMDVGSATNKASFLITLTLGVSKCGSAIATGIGLKHDFRIFIIPLSQNIRDQYRQPSCILFDKEKNFKSFGFEAKEIYENTKDRKDCFFFEGFKAAFYGKDKFDRKTQIKDALGREFGLFEVVKETVKYLKRETYRFINSMPVQMDESDICFVLSVPSTLTDSVRRFIADAAQEAGISRTRLVLCSEADAVVAYCKFVPCQHLLDRDSYDRSYVICIAGNQRVSFTAVDVDATGYVRESRDMGSGEWGFNMACGSFLKFLHDVFGDKIISEAERSDKEVLNELIYDFKTKSRHLSISSDMASYENFRISSILQKRKEQRHSAFDDGVSFLSDKLRCTRQKMFDFHKESLERTGNHLSARLKSASFKDISEIILVGEYAECRILQEHLAKTLPKHTIIVPMMPNEYETTGAILHAQDCSK